MDLFFFLYVDEWSGVTIDVEWVSVIGCIITGDFMHVDKC